MTGDCKSQLQMFEYCALQLSRSRCIGTEVACCEWAEPRCCAIMCFHIGSNRRHVVAAESRIVCRA